jgi:DNA polymerase III delta subunit
VLLWGDAPFLLREAARELFASPPTEADAAEWRPELLADLATPSLFGGDRGLLVTEAQDLGKDALAEVRRYADAPAEGSRLVLAAVVDARSKAAPKALASAVGDRGMVRRVAVDRKELPTWVRQRARAAGLAVTPAGVARLVETVGDDPGALDQAVAQLAAARPEEGLTPDAVDAQFRGFGDHRVWELTDAAFTGDLRRAVRVLAALLDAREEPLVIVGGIASRVRDLLRVRALPPRMPLREVATAAGLRFDWQARRYRDQANRYRPEELSAVHADVVEADRLLKQGGDGRVVLSRLVARIARPTTDRAAVPG